MWHLAGNETDCMVGFPSVMVISDAILKGIPGFDTDKAYEAIKAYENLSERGLKQIREMSYIPADQEGESVAKALEYCIADWSIAQVAKMLGKEEDYAHFLERSKGYTKYFDASDGFFKGRLAGAHRSALCTLSTGATTSAKATHGSTYGSCHTTSKDFSHYSPTKRP